VVFIIKISNFVKGVMPEIIIELNLGRKYSNLHLNLNIDEIYPKHFVQ
jgi:hypothetical protein